MGPESGFCTKNLTRRTRPNIPTTAFTRIVGQGLPTFTRQNNNQQSSMADSTAPAPPTEEVANLHLDEVTGERVSKTELKKRQKQRQKEAEKAAKAAAAPPKASGKPKNAAGEEEKDLNPNQYYEIRTRHINECMLIPPRGGAILCVHASFS